MTIPHYWMNESSGVLRPAIEAYLKAEPMTGEQISAMRGYLRQWIAADWFPTPELEALRLSVNWLYSPADIRKWLDAAMEEAIDPL